jgi:hypothetical protein
MCKQAHRPDNGRRKFARALLGLGVAAAAIGYAGTAASKTAPQDTGAPTPARPAQGYRLTPHIARYYRSARG